MASLSFNLCLFLVFFACLLLPISCKSHLEPRDNHVALFIFGDSTFDVGNNNYINTTILFQSNFRPYGETFFKNPTGRFSDGRLIPDFIAEYAGLPLIPPYKQPGNNHFTDGVNFASAGAGALVETFQGMVIDLKTQLSYFKTVEKMLSQQLGDKEAKQMVSRAVYLFSIGGNDYMSSFVTNSSVLQSYSQGEQVDMVISNITAVIKEIYREGGRKFGFFSLETLGCLPGIRVLNPRTVGDCVEEITALAKLHNKKLSKTLQELEKQLKGFKYSNFMPYTSYSERMDNPSKFGFKEGKSACCGRGPYRGMNSCGGKRGIKEYELCGNVSEYVFFDAAHPTEMANQQFANLMWNGRPEIVWPYNLKALFGITQ